jgi:hypothetical protein
MATTLAGKSAPVCDPNVTKALPSFHAVAPNPDRELAEARAAIDSGDERQALKRLDRARRGYLKAHDTAGLDHLLVLADVLEARDERTRIGRTNLVYAVKQNLRLESRRRARLAGTPWHDPYPDLAAPTEHTGIALGRGVKIAIGVATLLGAAAVVAVLVVPFLTSSGGGTSLTLRLVNDTNTRAKVRGCNDLSCDAIWMNAELDPGLATERTVSPDDLIDLFLVKPSGGHQRCLPVRVHDAYRRAGSDAKLVYVAKLSQATSCPGVTVLPRAVAETGL